MTAPPDEIASPDDAPEVVMSPSGRYRLEIQPCAGDGSRGVVTRVADGAVVADVTRDYPQFHHSFVDKRGREYLITGRSYTSQTIVDLDGGVELAAREPDASDNFCWVQCALSPDGDTLVVDGCVWACPYELRFFDFRDPAAGWPALALEGADHLARPSDARPPRWLADGTCECHQADADGAPQERTRVARRGDAMVVIEHWVSDGEQRRRDERRRLEAELDAWWETFTSTDPLYLLLQDRIRRHDLPCDHFYRSDHRRIWQYFRRTSPRASADFSWDVEAATVTVQRYDDTGTRADVLTFAATPTGLDDAVTALAAVFESPARGPEAR